MADQTARVAELEKKLSDARRQLALYETPGAICPHCGHPTVFVGKSPAMHPRCHEWELEIGRLRKERDEWKQVAQSFQQAAEKGR